MKSVEVSSEYTGPDSFPLWYSVLKDISLWQELGYAYLSYSENRNLKKSCSAAIPSAFQPS